jgi:hypothetical protein
MVASMYRQTPQNYVQPYQRTSTILRYLDKGSIKIKT